MKNCILCKKPTGVRNAKYCLSCSQEVYDFNMRNRTLHPCIHNYVGCACSLSKWKFPDYKKSRNGCVYMKDRSKCPNYKYKYSNS